MSSSPRIAVDLRALVGRPTGIGFFTLELLTALARLGGATYLGLSHAQTSRDEALRAAGIDLEHTAAPLGVIWQQWVLPRRIEKSDIDLLWSPLITLPIRLSKPGVVTIHDLTALLYPESHTIKVRLSIMPFLSKTVERARRIVVDSKATADDMVFHFPESAPKLDVVYPGVGEEFHPATAEEVAEIRSEIGCPDGYILNVGTLEPRKNIPALLDAWEALRRQEKNTPPLVVSGGAGWHSRGVIRRMERLRPLGVHYLGRTDRAQLIRLFQGARAFVYPSLYEGFGLPPLEAMACGVPTVTSNRSSLIEVAGAAALTADPGDPQELAVALRRLLEDRSLADEIGQRGRERAAGFRWDRAARQMETIFQESLQ